MRNFTLRPLIAALRSPRWSLALAGAVAPGLVLAAPSGGQVVAGQASIGGTGGNTVINQTSNAAVINWQQFSVGSSEYVVFNQPTASAAVLNRVVGGNPSEILGNISANGRVFLINPNGVMFGQGAKVDVNSLVATTLNISDNDFMQGRYAFAGAPGSTAEVRNAGRISAADGGFVVLAGGKVSNSGLVQARLGTVALASGSAVTLGLDSSGLVDFSVDGAALSAAAGVDNIGSLVADGGSVIMSAHTARGLIGNAVNNSGTVQARSIGEHEGSIYLLSEGGNIRQDGVVDASGTGQANGGKIRIAGDGNITLTGDSTTLAYGRGGGQVGVIAEKTMVYEKGARMDLGARQKGARGGVAEFSGHEDLKIRDTVALGYGGMLALDPAVFTIGNDGTISETDLENMLKTNFSGSTIQIVASDGIRLLNLQDGVLDGSTTNQGYGAGLALQIGSCYGGANICNSSFTPGSNGYIRFDDVNDGIKVNGGILIESGVQGGDVTIGSLTSTQGEVTINAAGPVSARDITAGDGYISIYTGGGTQGGVTTRNLSATNGDVDIDASTGNIVTGTINTTGASASVLISAEDGSITTRTITATARTSLLFQTEGGTASAVATVNLEAADGVSVLNAAGTAPGDITVTVLADQQTTQGSFLAGGVNIIANSSFDSSGYGGTAGGADISVGNITIDARASGNVGGVQASALAVIVNGSVAQTQSGQVLTGGDTKVGNVKVNAGGVEPQPFCDSSACSSAQTIIGSFGGDVTAGNLTVTAAPSSGSVATASVYSVGGGDVGLGGITMSGSSTHLQVTTVMDPTSLPDNGGGSLRTTAAKAITAAGGNITIGGRIQGVQNLDLFSSEGNITVDAGSASGAILPSGEDVDINIEAAGTVTLKGASLQLSGDIDARRLVIETSLDTIAESDANIDVGGLSIKARGIDLREAESISIGSESMDLGKDAALLGLVPAALRPSSNGPNAAFMASQGAQLGSFSLEGDYLFVRAPQIATFSISREGDLFYNFRPFADTANFTIPTGSLLGASDVTFAFGGTGYRGDITVNPPNLSTALPKVESNVNFLFLTQGRVNGKDLLSGATSGQVLVLSGSEEPQEPPEEEQMEQADSAQNAVSQMETTFSTEGIGRIEVADASLVEETSDSPEELECR